MNCQTVQNHLSAYIDCELDAELKREIRKHLFSCNECNTSYLEIQQLKHCLENSELPAYQFDAMSNLYVRLEDEKFLITQRPVFIIWTPRFLFAAACVSLFFLTAFAWFPFAKNGALTAESTNSNEPNATGVSFDRNISFDRSLTVYQASVILP